MNRDEIRASVRCPRCGVRPGEECIHDGRRRPANHPGRIALAEATIGWMERPAPFVAAEAARRAGRPRRR